MNNTYKSIPDALEDNTHILKVKKSCIQPIILIALGVLCFVLKSLWLADAHLLGMTTILIGLGFMVAGVIYLIKACVHSYDYVYTPTGKKCKKHIIYISQQDARKVNDAIHNDNFFAMGNLKKEANSSCYLEIVGNQDAPFYTFQLMAYVPHKFEPASDAVVLEGTDAHVLSHLINLK